MAGSRRAVPPAVGSAAPSAHRLEVVDRLVVGDEEGVFAEEVLVGGEDEHLRSPVRRRPDDVEVDEVVAEVVRVRVRGDAVPGAT